MGRLTDDIRSAVAEGRYVLSLHAAQRLRERRVVEWQIADGLRTAAVLSERSSDRPNPSIEVEQSLPDATPVKVIWSWLATSRLARLVTVHFIDR